MKKITLMAARINAGYSRKEVGNYLGVTEMCIGNWERGRTNPPKSAKMIMAKMYDWDVEDIIFSKEC